LLVALVALATFTTNIHRDLEAYLFTIAVAVLFGVGTWFLLAWSTPSDGSKATEPSQPAVLLSAYVGFIALSSFLASLSPHAETGMTAAFTGDLATASDVESRLNLALALGLLGWSWLRWHELTRQAFNQTVSFMKINATAASPRQSANVWWVFPVVTAIGITLSLQSLGLVFVVGSLFAPFVAVGKGQTNLSRFRLECVIAASLGALIGFLISLSSTGVFGVSLPTTPTILVFQGAIGFALRFIRLRGLV
jgi:zinc/manganese transport system permease protein/iron/zinc/copper transport system permease protein